MRMVRSGIFALLALGDPKGWCLTYSRQPGFQPSGLSLRRKPLLLRSCFLPLVFFSVRRVEGDQVKVFQAGPLPTLSPSGGGLPGITLPIDRGIDASGVFFFPFGILGVIDFREVWSSLSFLVQELVLLKRKW